MRASSPTRSASPSKTASSRSSVGLIPTPRSGRPKTRRNGCKAHRARPRAPGHHTRVTTARQRSAAHERIRFMGCSAPDHGADYKTTNTEESRHALEPGTPAPNFTLHTTPDQAVSLASFRGQPVILAFYPADWSPVCGDEVTLLNEVLPEFRRYNAELLGISVNGVWRRLAFTRDRT